MNLLLKLHFVIQSGAKNLGNIKVDAAGIFRHYVPLNDN